ncbi:response regulator [Pedobacter sp. SYSU D00535]|uniref:response regulator n=1 Tax=Pedobacter sp. SYSU D00535 TaxID=2810308 RepID=UPI001A9775E6|nr:response regulator [Pedobacter sp. SYSU D00535]
MAASIILIDDDPVQQKVAEVYVNRYKAFDQYNSFNKAKTALTFIDDNKLDPKNLPDVILLDLQMPDFSGWDFLDKFADLLPVLKKNIDIYILSSSLDPEDELKSKQYPCVQGFYTKPISRNLIKDISGKFVQSNK